MCMRPHALSTTLRVHRDSRPPILQKHHSLSLPSHLPTLSPSTLSSPVKTLSLPPPPAETPLSVVENPTKPHTFAGNPMKPRVFRRGARFPVTVTKQLMVARCDMRRGGTTVEERGRREARQGERGRREAAARRWGGAAGIGVS